MVFRRLKCDREKDIILRDEYAPAERINVSKKMIKNLKKTQKKLQKTIDYLKVRDII